MKVVIAGSRNLTDPILLEEAIRDSGFEITEVLCGRATGVDELGRVWAEAAGIPVRYFPADWKKWGKSAGPRRNAEMARECDALIAVTYGSRGTTNMVHQAQTYGRKIFIKQVPQPPARMLEDER